MVKGKDNHSRGSGERIDWTKTPEEISAQMARILGPEMIDDLIKADPKLCELLENAGIRGKR